MGLLGIMPTSLHRNAQPQLCLASLSGAIPGFRNIPAGRFLSFSRRLLRAALNEDGAMLGFLVSARGLDGDNGNGFLLSPNARGLILCVISHQPCNRTSYCCKYCRTITFTTVVAVRCQYSVGLASVRHEVRVAAAPPILQTILFLRHCWLQQSHEWNGTYTQGCLGLRAWDCIID